MTEQPTLFEMGTPDQKPVSFSPRIQGEQAAESCEARAVDRGWDSEGAAAFVLEYLGRHGPTSGELLVTEASKSFPPHDGRAFGAVFSRLSRGGKIACAGFAMRAKGHGTAGARVWELVR